MKKNIFFVRHGQSESNAEGVRQGFSGKLSDLGKYQAQIIADRVKNLKIDKIISSSAPRAEETSIIISETLNLPFDSSHLLIERKNPKSLIGIHRNHPEALRISLEVLEKYKEDPDFNLDGGESFNDLKKRALEILKQLENTEGENILVVTHGTFLRVMLGVIFYGQELTPTEYVGIFFGIQTMNTGLTWCFYDADRTPNPWCLVTFNDYSHLADN